MSAEDLAIAGLFLAMAALYSSVGHGGASGYLAVMALYGLSPAVMKPTALALNVLVASISTVQFARAGCFVWAKFWPFAVVSVPFALLGGSLTLPHAFYKRLAGAALLYSAYRLFRHAGAAPAPPAAARIPVRLALLLGAAIGLLSGLVGVGGGIFLSPLLLLAGWADPRTTAGVSAAFILANSAAGLAGHAASVGRLPPALGPWGLAAVAGGLFGSTLGSRRLPNPTLRRLLAVVLVIAAAKLILA